MKGFKGSLVAFGRNERHRLLLRTVWQMSNASLCEAASKVIALLMAAPTENIAKIIGLKAARDGGADSLNAAHLVRPANRQASSSGVPF